MMKYRILKRDNDNRYVCRIKGIFGWKPLRDENGRRERAFDSVEDAMKSIESFRYNQKMVLKSSHKYTSFVIIKEGKMI